MLDLILSSGHRNCLFSHGDDILKNYHSDYNSTKWENIGYYRDKQREFRKVLPGKPPLS